MGIGLGRKVKSKADRRRAWRKAMAKRAWKRHRAKLLENLRKAWMANPKLKHKKFNIK